jgi:5-(carboxyamino)imidazole ribonucleotide synthase
VSFSDGRARPAAQRNGCRIGVLGGGQLGRMLGLAGVPLGLQFLYLDPAPDACASAVGEMLQADFSDASAAIELAKRVDIATFDFENIPATSAQALEELCPMYPASTALGASQDRLVEKELLTDLGIAVPAFHPVSSRTDLLDGLDKLGYPAVLKTRRLGYDGKGQAILRDREDLERAWQQLGGSDLILEAFVAFDAECSLITARGMEGETASWPLTRNVHSNGILSLSLPGVFDQALQHEAEQKMQTLMDYFDYCGVLTMEFFILDGKLLVNEIAPRVHNSGHWTIDGACCSQFENHLRAISGLPLGDTQMTTQSMMFNWIGEMPDRSALMGIQGLHWHDYGKAPRPGRKIGHATLTADHMNTLKHHAIEVARISGGEFPALLKQLLD